MTARAVAWPEGHSRRSIRLTNRCCVEPSARPHTIHFQNVKVSSTLARVGGGRRYIFDTLERRVGLAFRAIRSHSAPVQGALQMDVSEPECTKMLDPLAHNKGRDLVPR